MSIIEVAKEAGVSKSTVSRVINYEPGVSDAHRKAVLAAMKTLDYQPSSRRPGPKPASQRGIRTGNVLMLVIGCGPGEVYNLPVLPSLLNGAESALADAGLNLVLAGLHPDKPIPTALSSGQVDGVLLIGSTADISNKARNILASLPTVLLLRNIESTPGVFDRVVYNNRAVGPIAAKHLHSKGHVHTAFINGDSEHHAYPTRQRLFARAMREYGAEVLELVCDSQAPDPQVEMDSLVRKIKAEMPSLTAVCLSSDGALPFLYRSLAAEGIKPQEDLEIVSCDNDVRIISTLQPKPTTIDIQADYMGHLAVRQLQWRMALTQQSGPISVVVEPILIPST